MSFKRVAQSLDPFIDPYGDLYVQVVLEGRPDPEAIPLDSRQGQAILRARLCDVVKRGHPTDHEARVAAAVIYGVALERERSVAVTSVEYLIARQPLARAILVLAHKGKTTKSPRALLAAVNDVAIKEGIDIKDRPWPKSEDSLGRQLKGLIEILARNGVAVSKSRGDERLWTVEPKAGESDGSDGQASSVSPEKHGISAQPDTSSQQNSPSTRRIEHPVTDDDLTALMNGESR